MTHLIRAELRSLRATPSIRSIAIAAVAIAALVAAVGTGDRLTDVLHAETIEMTLFTLVAGAIAGAGDFQHGTVVLTLLAAPRRPAAAAAKLVATAILGAGIAAAVLGTTWAVGALKHGGMAGGTGVGELVLGQLVLGGLTAAFGVGVGLALRNLPAALGAVFAVALVIPLVFDAKQSLADEIRFLPYGELSAAALALGSAPADYGPQLATLPAGLVLLGWTTLVSFLGLSRFALQDVS